MTPREAYLALTRAALWAPDAPLAEDCLAALSEEALLQEVLRIADSQRTRGLVCDLLLRSDLPLPAAQAAAMQRQLVSIAGMHPVLDTTVGTIVGALQQAGIPSVLLKGQGVAQLYPNPVLRECGDIDLYVGTERLEEAVRVLSPLASRHDDQLSGKRGKHWRLWFGKTELELHKESMSPETHQRSCLYRKMEATGLSGTLPSISLGGVSVDTPEDSFNAFYLFYHLLHHFVSCGIGFRQLCDWVLLLHFRHPNLDPARLRSYLKGMRMLRPWQLFGCIAVSDLGLPQEEFPFFDGSLYKQSRRILEMVFADGNFGYETQPQKNPSDNYLVANAKTLASHLRRFCKIFPATPHEAWLSILVDLGNGFRQIYRDLSKP
ncbi:MAG: nucleotidyltransferase family protein [Bacteroidales bacterium]|nr:nucleotidyltransferase family protein [Bacteroidales bacterium]